MSFQPFTVKYVIKADFEVEGVVEKPDVIGAVFGQTEGLFGSELDLRELQKTGRIGRIEIELKSEKDKTRGKIIIPTSLDRVSTAIIAASIESIERIGPCQAHVHLEKIEDIREAKRKAIIERAKEILHDWNLERQPETEEIFSGLYSAVLMSGTMPPRQYMVSLLGINPGRVDEVRLKGMVPESNRETVIVDRVTTRYRERSERMYSLIARYVKAVYDAIDSGVVLVVFPSYEVMKLVFEHVDVDEAVIEREDTDIEEVEAKVVKAGRILVFSVAGGKIVEGIEFRIGGRSLVKAVVIAGMPFPEPNIYNNALYRYLINKLRDRDTAWDLVFAVPAVVRMRQAAGRAIRSPEDRAVIVVLDRRFLKKRYLNYGEELARTVKLISDPDRLKVEIKNFLEGRG